MLKLVASRFQPEFFGCDFARLPVARMERVNKNENPEGNYRVEKSTKNFDWNNAEDRGKIEEIWTCHVIEKGVKILSYF